MHRRPHFRRWWPFLALVAVAARAVGPVLTAGDAGYLPAVGPPTLRFVAPRPSLTSPTTHSPSNAAAEPTRAAVIASVTASNTPASPGIASEPPPTVPAPATGAAPEWFGPPAPSTPPPAASINPAWLIPNASQTMMPQAQLFLQYFTPDYLTGSNGAGLVVPVGFVPPQPRASGSSSATYSVTPGGTGTGSTGASSTPAPK